MKPFAGAVTPPGTVVDHVAAVQVFCAIAMLASPTITMTATSSGVMIFFTANDEECLTDPRFQFGAACVEKSEDLTQLKRTIDSLLAEVCHAPKSVLRVGLPPAECAAPH